MTVAQIMKTKLISAQPDTPLSDIAGLLIEHRITGLPVVDGEHRIVGVITEMDLIGTLGEPAGAHTVASDVMTSNPITLPSDAPLHAAFDCLMTHTFRRVLIQDQGRLVGLISRTDLLPVILERFRT